MNSVLDLEIWVYLLTFCYSKQIEKVSCKNKGYGAEMTVVTYNRDKKENEDKAKLRILLVSIPPLTLSNHLLSRRFCICYMFGSVELEEGAMHV